MEGRGSDGQSAPLRGFLLELQGEASLANLLSGRNKPQKPQQLNGTWLERGKIWPIGRDFHSIRGNRLATQLCQQKHLFGALLPHPTRTIYHWPRLKMEFQLFKIILNSPDLPSNFSPSCAFSLHLSRKMLSHSAQSVARHGHRRRSQARPLQSTTSEVRHGEDLSKRERDIYIYRYRTYPQSNMAMWNDQLICSSFVDYCSILFHIFLWISWDFPLLDTYKV